MDEIVFRLVWPHLCAFMLGFSLAALLVYCIESR